MDDRTEELLSRGLDADLDRSEMRELYKLAAADSKTPKAMGDLAALEDSIGTLAEQTEAAEPKRTAADIMDAVLRGTAQPATVKRGIFQVFWDWFKSPNGFSVQPASFAVGLAACFVFVVMLNPNTQTLILGGGGTSEEPRLSVHDLQFASAQARLDWTYQFIVKPGASTKLALDAGDDRPVRLQLESAAETELSLIHRPPGKGRERVQRLSVDGISFATLRNPKQGDQVIIRNDGDVPVLIYAFTPGPDTGQVAEAESL